MQIAVDNTESADIQILICRRKDTGTCKWAPLEVSDAADEEHQSPGEHVTARA